MSDEASQIAVKKREAKDKGEKERYKHLNAEFQRIARRDKKAFLSDQCKEIEENNRMGKTRELFNKIRDIKGPFHAKMGSIKGQKWKKVEKTTRPFTYDLNQIPYNYTGEVRNRLKVLDLIDRVTDELWMEVHDIVQEAVIKTIPKKKEMHKAK